MSELSRRILQRRLELGLSQEELAQRMGYRSKSSITKLEKGVNDIPQAKLEELAAALETTPAYLLGLDVPCPPPGSVLCWRSGLQCRCKRKRRRRCRTQRSWQRIRRWN